MYCIPNWYCTCSVAGFSGSMILECWTVEGSEVHGVSHSWKIFYTDCVAGLLPIVRRDMIIRRKRGKISFEKNLSASASESENSFAFLRLNKLFLLRVISNKMCISFGLPRRPREYRRWGKTARRSTAALRNPNKTMHESQICINDGYTVIYDTFHWNNCNRKRTLNSITRKRSQVMHIKRERTQNAQSIK